jgi:hypothetical protein
VGANLLVRTADDLSPVAEILVCVRRGSDHPQPRRARRDRWRADPLYEDAIRQRFLAHPHCGLRLADDERHYRDLALSNGMTAVGQFSAQDSHVGPQPLHNRRLVTKESERRPGRGD